MRARLRNNFREVAGIDAPVKNICCQTVGKQSENRTTIGFMCENNSDIFLQMLVDIRGNETVLIHASTDF